MADILSGLNDAQRRAVLHERGPLLVLAGPGSGKTAVITRHLAHRLTVRGADPRRLLAITFTNRAAGEMRRRVAELLGHEVAVPIGTFHAMCSSLLRRHSRELGFRREFRLMTPVEARAVLREVLPATVRPLEAARAIAALKNGASPAEAARMGGIPEGRLLAWREAYDTRLRALTAVDLDDLLARAAALLRERQDIRELSRARLDVILVDEFQDTNPVQTEIVRLLAPSGETVVAVGDDDQAIYSWRQAGGGAALFRDAFPTARTELLRESYRHTKRILRTASALIDPHGERPEMALRTARPAGELPVGFSAADEREEAAWVSERIEEAIRAGTPPSEIAVLYRVNAQSRAIEDALVRHDIPYRVVAGSRFYQRPEVQRVLAYLQLALDPAGEAGAALLALGTPGMGSARVAQLERSAAAAGVPLLDMMGRDHAPAMIPRPVQARLRQAVERLAAVTALRHAALTSVASAAIEAVLTDLEPHVAEVEMLRENLEELRTVTAEFAALRGTLRGLVDRLTLHTPDERSSGEVSLLSLHAAKGLEFATVFVIGVEEGLLPHRRSLEREEAIAEERRLLYVGMTRARDRLYLSHAQFRLLGGHVMGGTVSRFLRELSGRHIRHEVSPRVARRPRLSLVTVGEPVRHSRWGAGTVLSVEGQGRETLVTVDFGEIGRQRVQLCHAPLTRGAGREDELLGG